MKKLLLLSILFASCGPSAEEIAKRNKFVSDSTSAYKDSVTNYVDAQAKAKMDSLAHATINEQQNAETIAILLRFGHKKSELENLSAEKLDSMMYADEDKLAAKARQ